MAAAVPYIIMAAGTAASMQAQRQQNKERRAILNQSMAETDQARQQAADVITKEGAKYTPDQRMAEMQAQEQAMYDRAMQDRGQSGATIDTAGDAGNVSADFVKAKADRQLQEGERLTAIAREIARTRAPGQQLAEEGMRRADVTGQAGSIWSRARAMANARQLDAQGVEEPLYGTVGRLAAAIGGSMGGGAAGGAGKMTPSLAASVGQTSLAPQSDGGFWGSGSFASNDSGFWGRKPKPRRLGVV